MCDAFVWSRDVLTSFSWLELIKTLAPVATAVIALIALRNWQRQDKAKREIEFLDVLIEAAHAYIVQMPKPITLLDMAKIGMQSHESSRDDGDRDEKAINGAITYIKQRGEEDSKRLLGVLDAVWPSLINLRSLAVKGQMFGFIDYTKCQDAIAMLTWHAERIASFTSIIDSPSMNWDNPRVRRTLSNVMTIDPDYIRKNIQENNVALIEFARASYRRIYR